MPYQKVIPVPGKCTRSAMVNVADFIPESHLKKYSAIHYKDIVKYVGFTIRYCREQQNVTTFENDEEYIGQYLDPDRQQKLHPIFEELAKNYGHYWSRYYIQIGYTWSEETSVSPVDTVACGCALERGS
ncbi:hypothetical protein TNCV_416131 [Trichonephila clavipes]|nr:hypothetical protein TNCV_416131 [Trichonephila clavipes]